jgi:hypothetical protein
VQRLGLALLLQIRVTCTDGREEMIGSGDCRFSCPMR